MMKNKARSSWILCGTIAVLVGVLWPFAACSAGRPTQAPAAQGINKIRHIIWIIQENRSFDTYFGTYPGADGIPPGTCLPVLPGSGRCIKPFHLTTPLPPCDLAHSWV